MVKFEAFQDDVKEVKQLEDHVENQENQEVHASLQCLVYDWSQWNLLCFMLGAAGFVQPKIMYSTRNWNCQWSILSFTCGRPQCSFNHGDESKSFISSYALNGLRSSWSKTSSPNWSLNLTWTNWNTLTMIQHMKLTLLTLGNERSSPCPSSLSGSKLIISCRMNHSMALVLQVDFILLRWQPASLCNPGCTWPPL